MSLDATIKEYVNDAVNEAIKAAFAERDTQNARNTEQDSFVIRGISGLAQFLHVSIPTAQKLKNQNLFPCSQWGRILIFKSDEVLAGMAKRKKRV